VQALCAIQVEFYGGDRHDKKVMEAWKVYQHFLNLPAPSNTADQATQDVFQNEREDKFNDLLHELGKSIGKNYPKNELKSTGYGPALWWETEMDNIMLRKGMLTVLQNGGGVLPVGIKYEITQPASTPAQAGK
jgi:hypothetical protein